MWAEHQSLMQIPKEAIFESRVQWGPVPTWGKPDSSKKAGGGRLERDGAADFKGECAVCFEVVWLDIRYSPCRFVLFCAFLCSKRLTLFLDCAVLCGVIWLPGEWKEATAMDGKPYYWYVRMLRCTRIAVVHCMFSLCCTVQYAQRRGQPAVICSVRGLILCLSLCCVFCVLCCAGTR